MPYLAKQRTTGDSNVIMKQVRKPVFVDNALHLGEITPQGSAQAKVTVKQRKTASYAVASTHSYTIDEREDNIILTHTPTPGHSSETAIFYMDSKLEGNDVASNTPPLLFSINTQTERLALGATSTGNKGTTFAVRNLKGRTLDELGFTSTAAFAAQPVDVGLRTSDMAIRLGRDVADSLTSVNIALPISPTNSGSDRRRHSTRFVATDFYGVNLVTALRFLGRHDNHIVYFERFGSLLYVPFNFGEAGRFVDHNARDGPAVTNPIENASNRIVVQGQPLAVNDLAFAEVSDAERQSGRGGDVQQEPQSVEDFTVRNNESARRVARSILKANNLLAGNKTSSGHPQSWDLRPGKVIEYEGVSRILTEVKHNLSKNTADLVFLTVDTGIEGVLQGIVEGAQNTGSRPEIVEQITESNLSLFGDITLVIRPTISMQGHGSSGFIIGRAMNRGSLGGSDAAEVVGGSKTTVIRFRGEP